METGTLNGLTELKTLKLIKYPFDGVIPANFFSSLSAFPQLDLSFYSIFKLQNESFIGLTSLQRLHLNNKHLLLLKSHYILDIKFLVISMGVP